ncbi:MAG TPA: FeoB-associated Cys-rich membrane protein [Candidatus Hydrogenedentes bacterium]|nr:FeoB-associated Cys-rich membrane protein [Candidatus Hydrogenedentota bacterium]HRK35324.1 FeoB-associated Cys-rich membrane protein [Candidatus Hydrogenedentota bacterium]
MSVEGVIVGLIVGACALYLGRHAYRMLMGKPGGACGCSDCPSKTVTPKTKGT